jgi:membrane-associated protease RseP (regulator of RpoE activity)
MKDLLLALAVAAALCTWSNSAAAQKTDNPSQPQSQESAVERARPYLGVAVEPLHTSLVNRISNLIGGEYGVLVDEVAADSPAAAAGLKPADVIHKYDDQKIFNGEQFLRLVRSDKPGRAVTLGIIRDGKQENIKVALGEREVLTSERQRRTAFRPTLPNRAPANSNEASSASWMTFDSLRLTRDDNNHFKAEISYRDQNGKVVTKTFAGARDEIAKSIASQHDMPAVERNHLLRALDLPQSAE